MQDVNSAFLTETVRLHEAELKRLRRELLDDRAINERHRTDDFVRRANALQRDILDRRQATPQRNDRTVTPSKPSRRDRVLPRVSKRGRIGGMELQEVIRRNTEAFDRHAATFERQIAAMDRQAERFDRQTERFDRQSEILDRLVETATRLALNTNNNSDVLRNEIAELRRFGELLDKRTSAVLDAFALLAGDVRRAQDR